MSRTVIHDVVIPIVQRIIVENRYHRGFGASRVHDIRLEEFLEEEMRRHFGVMGANGCQHLREQLEEARKNDPYSFEQLVRRLLYQYVRLAAKIRNAKKIKKNQKESSDQSKKRARKKNAYIH
ncbi:MAG: hypothetical protein NWE78_03890 [Candidatus Bathyarchaeota archaeon]|nr:hypothetical protein [Candidatus Bathyarchaeota archaeon]